MSLSEVVRGLGVRTDGVVHVGAHRGQEVSEYRKAGFGLIRLVEPEPGLAERLRRKFPDCEVVEKVCVKSKSQRRRRFHVANFRQWSSLIEPPRDQSKVEGRVIEVAETITVDAVTLAEIQDGCTLAVVDAQGSEPDVLAGADLEGFDAVIVETVAPGDVWRPAWNRVDADAWFAERGWRAVHEFEHSAPDVRDVVYVRG